MGFSSGAISHFVQGGQSGTIPKGARVLELGSQNIWGEISPTLAREFMNTFGASPSDTELEWLTRIGGKSEPLLDAAGFDYTAFDVYEEGRTRIFDLNAQTLGPQDIGRYDVVTNYGTTEHICNQFNAFRVAHDALKVGGVMINSVPFHGSINHGLFNYHPKFFTSLIHNNDYKALYFGLSDIYDGGASDRYHAVAAAENGEAWEGKYLGSAEICVIFRKTRATPFMPPVDTGGDSLVTIESVYTKPRATRSSPSTIPPTFVQRVQASIRFRVRRFLGM